MAMFWSFQRFEIIGPTVIVQVKVIPQWTMNAVFQLKAP